MGFLPFDLGVTEAPRPAVEWEECSCLLCAGGRWSILVEAPDPTPGGGGLWFAVVQCQDCGLCFTNPRPTPRSMGQFYPDQYLPHRRRQRAATPWWRRLPLLRRRSRRERQILPRCGQGRLLDFGCGGGAFLEQMHRAGWQVTGVDMSESAVRRVRAELGVRALAGSLPHPALPEQGFDVVTMWHSLEHVHAPLEVLRAARRLLAPGGRLVVEVPNIDSLPFAWFGQAWFGLDLPRHLTHFVPETLRRMLERAGFEVGPVRRVRHSDWLRASAELACRLSGGRRWQRWLRAKLPASLVSWYSHLTARSDSIRVTALNGQPARAEDIAPEPAGEHSVSPRSDRLPPGDRFRNM
jgi:2-polyprenyl-3-methyl-5-hydroxy-6-metoxy-1,4-benzoquinol methylase